MWHELRNIAAGEYSLESRTPCTSFDARNSRFFAIYYKITMATTNAMQSNCNNASYVDETMIINLLAAVIISLPQNAAFSCSLIFNRFAFVSNIVKPRYNHTY